MYNRNFFHVCHDTVGGYLLYAGRTALHRFPNRYSADKMCKLLMSHLNLLKFKEVDILVNAILLGSNLFFSRECSDGKSRD